MTAESERLDWYFDTWADVAVRVGANVQPGQPLVVFGTVNHVPLVRAIGRAAWEAGAGDVQLVYGDDYDRYLLARYGSDEVLTRAAVAIRAAFDRLLDVEGASISVLGDDAPPFFADVDGRRLARAVPLATIELAQRAINERRNAWCVVPFPEAGWATRVFGTPDVDRLAREIAAACRLDDDDPVASWVEHLASLERRAAALDAAEIDEVHLSGPGTNLRIGLLPQSRWLGGRGRTRWGQLHCANLPTEEVFTTPDLRRVEGTVTATRPVAREGVVVEGIRLEFREGKIVDASATAGEDSLLQQLDVDEGARRLGEVALVAGSRVGATNLLFYNTLFDENATSHLAYGMAYATAVDGAGSLSAEEQLAAGVNQSHVHVDFPVGGPDVEITATTRDGRRITLVEGDRWAFTGA